MLRFQVFAILTCLFSFGQLSAQQFPDVIVRTLDRQSTQLGDYVGQGKTVVVAVWSTTCANCIIELDQIKSYVDKWSNDYQAEVIAVSMDQYQQIRKVKPLVNGRQWPYKVFIDNQRQLGRLLNFTTIPQLFVVNGQGTIIKQYGVYKQGREHEIDQILATLR